MPEMETDQEEIQEGTSDLYSGCYNWIFINAATNDDEPKRAEKLSCN